MTRPLKPWLSLEAQIALLRSRGMEVANRRTAEHQLAAVGYYRLSGYWYPYRRPDPSGETRRLSEFTTGTSFTEITDLYTFDRHLKSHVLSGIEQIEVAARSRIGYLLGEISPMAHTDADKFRPTFDHAAWWKTVTSRIGRARGRDEFVDHHYGTYGGQIPIWVLTDLLDFSDLSKLYAGMRAADQKTIADWFRVTVDPDSSKAARQKWAKHPPLANWLEHLTVVRNICAHHGRLWNRQLPPIGASQRIRHLAVFDGLPEDQTQVERIHGTICIIAYLLDSVAPGNPWRDEIDSLVSSSFAKITHRHPSEMGVPNSPSGGLQDGTGAPG
ncbi:Abi family protein [Tsukamurella spumae]|uniref:Abi family protein n=1 Tax=Tsukamurella spumae TaxID=44753 RepID=A0A846X8P7_9ACTN|nr:Abi family protein [Tsukamurella spumae]NKY20649.1 Abi family protein [Tsukamurella spumae]